MTDSQKGTKNLPKLNKFKRLKSTTNTHKISLFEMALVKHKSACLLALTALKEKKCSKCYNVVRFTTEKKVSYEILLDSFR